MWFLGEPTAVQRRLVKAIGENAGIPLEFKHVEEILRVRSGGSRSGKELSLPLGWKMVRGARGIGLRNSRFARAASVAGLRIRTSRCRDESAVYEAGSSIEVRRIPDGADAGYNPDHLSGRGISARTVKGAELASGRPILAGSYEVPQEDQGTAARASCGAAGAQVLAGGRKRRRRSCGCEAFRPRRIFRAKPGRAAIADSGRAFFELPDQRN